MDGFLRIVFRMSLTTWMKSDDYSTSLPHERGNNCTLFIQSMCMPVRIEIGFQLSRGFLNRSRKRSFHTPRSMTDEGEDYPWSLVFGLWSSDDARSEPTTKTQYL